MEENDFARLERTSRGQCLVRVTTKTASDGRYGPAVAIRISEVSGIDPEITIGPFTDDEAGYAAAFKTVRDMDMEKAANRVYQEVEALIGGKHEE
jgi:hypothetical protein